MLLQLFRGIAVIEGITTLALVLIAMPPKYLAGNEAIMPLAGWGHGYAFVAYMLAIIPALWGKGFTAWEWTQTVLASLVPFGTFLNDPMLKRKLPNREA
jgi:integral membrane protein